MNASNGVWRDRALFLLFFLAVFILAVTKVEDTDTWTHLSFGRWIWEHKALPSQEPFIQTSQPFPYNNWLFGFIYYLIYLVGNISGVILFKAFTVVIACTVLLKDALLPRRNPVVAVLVLTVLATMLRSRFIERPDTFLMIFLPACIYALRSYVLRDNIRYLYALPVIHMLWANSHTSIPLMLIPFMAFLTGGLVQHVLKHKGFELAFTPSFRQMKMISIFFALSFAASLVSPYFIGQYLHSVSAIQSDWWKQEIIELMKPTWSTFPVPFYIAAVLIVALLLSVWIFVRVRLKGAEVSPSGNANGDIQPFSIIDVLLVIPFMYLAFDAIRFAYIFGVIAGPIIARSLSAGIQRNELFKKHADSKIVPAIAAVLVMAITAVTIANANPINRREFVFGLGVRQEAFPEGALRYMDQRGVVGKIYNLFQWGGYIIWRDFPKRIPLIDGRGFVDQDMLEQYNIILRKPALMNDMSRQYGFSAILMMYPMMKTDVHRSFTESDFFAPRKDWALVYWDDESLLYLKRGEGYDDVIARDEYLTVNPIIGIDKKDLKSDTSYRERCIAELIRNTAVSGSSRARSMLGSVYVELGRYREAVEQLLQVKDAYLVDFRPGASRSLGIAYYQLGVTEQAIKYLEQANAFDETAEGVFLLGSAYAKKGDDGAALKYFKKALLLDRNFLSPYPLVIGIYRQSGKTREAEQAEEAYVRARNFHEAKDQFEAGVKNYLQRNYFVAADHFKKSIQLNPENAAAYANLGFIYFDMGDLTQAENAFSKSLEVGPTYANAHYGMAMLCERRGDNKSAKAYWKRYLELEPAGYFTRRAKKALDSLE